MSVAVRIGETAVAGLCFVAAVSSPWWAMWPLLAGVAILYVDVLYAIRRAGEAREGR